MGDTGEMLRLPFRAMGCAMLVARDGGRSMDREDLAEVPAWFADWESRLSRFRPESEVSRLNAAAGRSMPVSPVLWELLRAAMAAAEWTDGLVTPTVLEAVERAGYDRSFEALVAPGPERAGGLARATTPGPLARHLRPRPGGRPAPVPSWRAIGLDPRALRVTLPAGLRLDFGGTAKGWAADEAARRLSGAGPVLVDAGGDIAVSGPRPGGKRWPVAVANPFAPDRHLAMLWLGHGGIATSGRDHRHWQREGRRLHHLIDPRTGQPAVTDVVSATVVAGSARLAEAAAKAALILGRRAGLAWIEAHPPLAALLVTDDGETHASRRLATHLGA